MNLANFLGAAGSELMTALLGATVGWQVWLILTVAGAAIGAGLGWIGRSSRDFIAHKAVVRAQVEARHAYHLLLLARMETLLTQVQQGSSIRVLDDVLHESRELVEIVRGEYESFDDKSTTSVLQVRNRARDVEVAYWLNPHTRLHRLPRLLMNGAVTAELDRTMSNSAMTAVLAQLQDKLATLSDLDGIVSELKLLIRQAAAFGLGSDAVTAIGGWIVNQVRLDPTWTPKKVGNLLVSIDNDDLYGQVLEQAFAVPRDQADRPTQIRVLWIVCSRYLAKIGMIWVGGFALDQKTSEGSDANRHLSRVLQNAIGRLLDGGQLVGLSSEPSPVFFVCTDEIAAAVAATFAAATFSGAEPSEGLRRYYSEEYEPAISEMMVSANSSLAQNLMVYASERNRLNFARVAPPLEA